MFGWIKNIGLSWKVQLAPTFLILVLIGVGAYALQALRSNQTAVDALVSGPVRQASSPSATAVTKQHPTASCPSMRHFSRE